MSIEPVVELIDKSDLDNIKVMQVDSEADMLRVTVGETNDERVITIKLTETQARRLTGRVMKFFREVSKLKTP